MLYHPAGTGLSHPPHCRHDQHHQLGVGWLNLAWGDHTLHHFFLASHGSSFVWPVWPACSTGLVGSSAGTPLSRAKTPAQIGPVFVKNAAE